MAVSYDLSRRDFLGRLASGLGLAYVVTTVPALLSGCSSSSASSLAWPDKTNPDFDTVSEDSDFYFLAHYAQGKEVLKRDIHDRKGDRYTELLVEYDAPGRTFAFRFTEPQIEQRFWNVVNGGSYEPPKFTNSFPIQEIRIDGFRVDYFELDDGRVVAIDVDSYHSKPDFKPQQNPKCAPVGKTAYLLDDYKGRESNQVLKAVVTDTCLCPYRVGRIGLVSSKEEFEDKVRGILKVISKL